MLSWAILGVRRRVRMLAKVGEQEVGNLADIRRQSQDCAEGRRWADWIAQGGSGCGYRAGLRDTLNQKKSGLSSAC